MSSRLQNSTGAHIRVHRREAVFRARRLTPWLFLLPAIMFNLLVMTGPAIGTVVMSLTDWNGFASLHFIGLQNYIKMFHDTSFYSAIWNNFQWMIIFCTIPIVLALLVALLLTKIRWGRTLFRVMFFLPYAVSTVLVSEIWSWIYDPIQGIDTILTKIGIQNPPLWLGNPHIVLYCIALVGMWQGWGFLLVIFISALSQLDKSLEEASLMEGATTYQRFWHVTLPQLRSAITLVLMLSVIGSFTVFDFVYLMTQGGPGSASQVLASYMYQTALYNQQPGYASAIATTMGIFAVIVLLLFGMLRKRGWDI